MLNALDKASGRLIDAQEARPRGVYACPCCRVRVFLTRETRLPGGRWRTAYFFHRPKEGKPECERFVASRSLYSGAVGTAGVAAPRSSLAPTELCFGVADGQPAFSLVLPPYPAPARGAVIVIAGESLHRELPCAALEAGKSIAIPLRSAPWRLSFRGEIDPDYQAGLQDNDSRLATDPILFHAELGSGRRVRAGEKLTAGDPLWILTREAEGVLARKPEGIAVIHKFGGHPWQAIAVILPDDADAQVLESCSRWLGHRILPERPRAFVAAPLPMSTNASGNFLFRAERAPILVCATQRTHLQIRCVATDRMQCEAQDADRLEWTDPAPGTYSVRCDALETEIFEVALHCETKESAFLLAAVDDGPEETFLQVAARLQRAPTLNGKRLRLNAIHPIVAKILKVDGHAVEPMPPAGSWWVDLTRPASVDAQALGVLDWQPARSQQTSQLEAPSLAKWLQGVASCGRTAPLVRLRGTAAEHAPAWLAPLAGARWEARFEPQLRTLQNQLIQNGLWNAARSR